MSTKRKIAGGGLNRRRFFRVAAAGAGALVVPRVFGSDLPASVSLPFATGERKLVAFPQKRPLIVLTMRPPQLETPFSVFNDGIFTPNDAFFVRYHLGQVPTEVDAGAFRVNIAGMVNSPLRLSLGELKSQFEQVEVAAVNQCSGNSRGFSKPRVPGGQLGNGAMGNARWKGVRLRDVLKKAGVAAGARQVTFNGADGPVSDKTPDFVKAIDVDHALDGEPMLAYQMNGEDLPLLNGYPLRLIVPGYYGTYWVKHVTDITVVDDAFAGYWMSTAYRIPDDECACVEPGTTPKATRPIGRLNVRSFITSLADGDQVSAGRPITVRGIAFDGGYGISSVAFSEDGTRSWKAATLGYNYGNYSFREWSVEFMPRAKGEYLLGSRAIDGQGKTQPLEATWNPAGYMRNVVESVRVTAV
jgi:DMSO/TMAO reductase YedYZ molybdopterin-dependent catalytic subunit